MDQLKATLGWITQEAVSKWKKLAEKKRTH